MYYDASKNFGLPRQIVDINFERTPIASGDELIDFLRAQVKAATRDGKAALALSGGIDSAILAKFMPEGSAAYTFRFVVPGKKSSTKANALLITPKFASSITKSSTFIGRTSRRSSISS